MYRQKVTVMPSEAACTGEIKIRALLNRFQDTASLAVADREGSLGDLIRRGYGWVLLKYRLEVLTRLPGIDESFTIETRHTLGDGFHTLRAFRVFDTADESKTLILARTSWVLIDLAASRPVRASQHLPEVFEGLEDVPPIDPEFVSIPRLKDTPVLSETSFPVRFHDLDTVGHVNNAVYFEWACEATPLDLTVWSVREMHAEFRVSVRLGATVLVRVKEAADFVPQKPCEKTRTFAYEILELGESKESLLARFLCVWQVMAS